MSTPRTPLQQFEDALSEQLEELAIRQALARGEDISTPGAVKCLLMGALYEAAIQQEACERVRYPFISQPMARGNGAGPGG